MESQQIAASTYPAQEFAQSFFQELPTDSRFLQNSFTKFSPTSSVLSDTITFDLLKFDAANLYMLNHACLEVKIEIKKANGESPDLDKKVWPVNNILHSLFSIVRVNLNERPIVKQPDLYAYKAYIATLLTYSSEYKNAQLASQGWHSDLGGHFSPSQVDYLVSSGHQLRHLAFRKGEELGAPFKTGGVSFFGRLQIDLISAESGLIPGTRVQVQLVKSPDSFFLLRQPGDNENYQFHIRDCYLYVPIAQLSATVFSELNTILTRKSVALHYRRTEVTPLTIPTGKTEFLSDALFQDGLPCRIVLCFVDTEAKKGHYGKNPFEFRRSWRVLQQRPPVVERREYLLEQQLQELKATVLELKNALSSKGKS